MSSPADCASTLLSPGTSLGRRKAFEVESTDADSPFVDLPPEIQLVERRFRPLLLLTSAALAFAHGGNDVANAVGPFSVIWEYHKNGDFLELGTRLPFAILAIGGIGTLSREFCFQQCCSATFFASQCYR